MLALKNSGRVSSKPLSSVAKLRTLKSAGIATATAPSEHCFNNVSSRSMPAQHVSPFPSALGRREPLPKMQAPEAARRQVLGNVNNSDFYQAVEQIAKIREQYIQERTVFVRGEMMRPILLGLGATEEDLALLPQTSDHLGVDPTMAFRTSGNSRFCFDFDSKTMRRLENQPFILSEDEDFVRWDSGRVRNFPELQANIGLNSAFLAVLMFKAMMAEGIDIARRPNLDYDVNRWICIAFSVRTHTTSELVGEPALEGVHSNGADHTLVTFLGADNMTPNSAATFLHDMDEVTGTPLRDASPLRIVGRNRHGAFLDTMMIVDHERKHSLTAVHALDKARKATRDVLIFFTRKPYLSTHPGATIDSQKSHAKFPVELPLMSLT